MQSFSDFLPVDPNLAHNTRVGHWVLFVFGTLLLIPAALVMGIATVLFVKGSWPTGATREQWLMITAIAGTSTGVLAWAALGLLFFKRADPRFHAVAWSLVLLFSLVAFGGCLHWLASNMSSAPPFALVLFAVLVGCLLGFCFAVPALQQSIKSWQAWHCRCRQAQAR